LRLSREGSAGIVAVTASPAAGAVLLYRCECPV